jgi:hypothetical protein
VNPATLFWMTAFLSTLVIRALADYAKLRFYVKGVHIHHFVWGIISAFIAFAALYYDWTTAGMIFGGIGVALIASEAKELILQRWKK